MLHAADSDAGIQDRFTSAKICAERDLGEEVSFTVATMGRCDDCHGVFEEDKLSVHSAAPDQKFCEDCMTEIKKGHPDTEDLA